MSRHSRWLILVAYTKPKVKNPTLGLMADKDPPSPEHEDDTIALEIADQARDEAKAKNQYKQWKSSIILIWD